MTLPLDHLVILVPDLERAIADYTALGFTVQRGGTHAGGATHNALIGFADGSYLELIAFLRDDPDHRWARWQREGWSGFVDFALLPDDVGRVVRAANARGLAYQGPIPGGRVRPDGEQLAWQIGAPPTPDLPFLCGDLTPRSLRVREGEVRVHANGARSVASVTLAVLDLPAALARWRALLGLPSDLGTIQSLDGDGLQQARLPLGAATLLLVSPQGQGAGGQALRELLSRRGEGVIGLTLHGTAGATAGPLDLARTHGAPIDLQPAAVTA